MIRQIIRYIIDQIIAYFWCFMFAIPVLNVVILRWLMKTNGEFQQYLKDEEEYEDWKKIYKR